MYSDTKIIANNEDVPLKVFVESCAWEVDILPGETYTFISNSKIEGKFEIENTE